MCVYQNITRSHHLDIVDRTHVGSATASFKDLVGLYRRISTEDILVRDQQRPPLDMDHEQELPKPNELSTSHLLR